MRGDGWSVIPRMLMRIVDNDFYFMQKYESKFYSYMLYSYKFRYKYGRANYIQLNVHI